MENNIQVFNYESTPIEFDLSTKNVMINATEMAKIFKQDVYQFLRTDTTKAFINECLNTANLRYLNIENEKGLLLSKPKSGTWMHNVYLLLLP